MPSLKTYLVDVDRETGEYISGWTRIRQSIITILTTRVFTRIMRLWWGSDFQSMIDKPINEETVMNGIMAIVRAINKYEPEFQIVSVEIPSADATGTMTIIVNGIDLIQNQSRVVVATL